MQKHSNTTLLSLILILDVSEVLFPPTHLLADNQIGDKGVLVTHFHKAGYEYKDDKATKLEWPRDHVKFAVKEQIKTLFLMSKRDTLFSLLPRDMLMLICHMFTFKFAKF